MRSKEGLLIRGVKRLALIRYRIDLTITRRIRAFTDRPAFELGGACNCCGKCCETPTIPIHPALFYFKSVRWLTVKWQNAVNGFEFLDENRYMKHLVFRCRHWDPHTKRCHVYRTRPGMCRDYPRNLLDDPAPEFLDGCGYYTVLKNAQKMRDALINSGLPDDKIKELSQKLHLDHEPSE